jgi:hypothetical protein
VAEDGHDDARQPDADRDAERRAQQRGDDALAAHHARTCRRVMPTARSIPISRVRSNVASTSVLASPKRLTITASASSTSKIASSWLMPAGLLLDVGVLGEHLCARERPRPPLQRARVGRRGVEQRQVVLAPAEAAGRVGLRADGDRPQPERVDDRRVLDAADGQRQAACRPAW